MKKIVALSKKQREAWERLQKEEAARIAALPKPPASTTVVTPVVTPAKMEPPKPKEPAITTPPEAHSLKAPKTMDTACQTDFNPLATRFGNEAAIAYQHDPEFKRLTPDQIVRRLDQRVPRNLGNLSIPSFAVKKLEQSDGCRRKIVTAKPYAHLIAQLTSDNVIEVKNTFSNTVILTQECTEKPSDFMITDTHLIILKKDGILTIELNLKEENLISFTDAKFCCLKEGNLIVVSRENDIFTLDIDSEETTKEASLKGAPISCLTATASLIAIGDEQGAMTIISSEDKEKKHTTNHCIFGQKTPIIQIVVADNETMLVRSHHIMTRVKIDTLARTSDPVTPHKKGILGMGIITVPDEDTTKSVVFTKGRFVSPRNPEMLGTKQCELMVNANEPDNNDTLHHVPGRVIMVGPNEITIFDFTNPYSEEPNPALVPYDLKAREALGTATSTVGAAATALGGAVSGATSRIASSLTHLFSTTPPSGPTTS